MYGEVVMEMLVVGIGKHTEEMEMMKEEEAICRCMVEVVMETVVVVVETYKRKEVEGMVRVVAVVVGSCKCTEEAMMMIVAVET